MKTFKWLLLPLGISIAGFRIAGCISSNSIAISEFLHLPQTIVELLGDLCILFALFFAIKIAFRGSNTTKYKKFNKSAIAVLTGIRKTGLTTSNTIITTSKEVELTYEFKTEAGEEIKATECLFLNGNELVELKLGMQLPIRYQESKPANAGYDFAAKKQMEKQRKQQQRNVSVVATIVDIDKNYSYNINSIFKIKRIRDVYINYEFYVEKEDRFVIIGESLNLDSVPISLSQLQIGMKVLIRYQEDDLTNVSYDRTGAFDKEGK